MKPSNRIPDISFTETQKLLLLYLLTFSGAFSFSGLRPPPFIFRCQCSTRDLRTQTSI